MFIGVRKTNNTIQAHKADLLPNENSEMMNYYISPMILEILERQPPVAVLRSRLAA